MSCDISNIFDNIEIDKMHKRATSHIANNNPISIGAIPMLQDSSFPSKNSK